LPDKKYDQIKASSEGLKVKAGAITKVALPPGLESQVDKFKPAAEEQKS
jgi:hypothetical protein